VIMPPVKPTVVTDPEPLLLKVVQSVLVRYPLTDVVAAGIEMAGVAPPEETTGEVPVTLVTVPVVGVVHVGVPAPALVNTCPFVPAAVYAIAVPLP
jgi:hypothetical protein